MNRRRAERPVSRPRVLVGGLVLLAVLAGIVALAESLRHPVPDGAATAIPDSGDPRAAVTCPDPAVIEQQAGEGVVLAVTSDELLDCPHIYDRRTIRYEGEAVGALMRRSEGVWTQLNDDAYAGDAGPLPIHREFHGGNSGIGVLLPHDLGERLERTGGPRMRGDVLTIEGIYYLSDPASGEVAIIRATGGEITMPGQAIEHTPLRARQIAGVVLALAAIGLLAIGRVHARRS